MKPTFPRLALATALGLGLAVSAAAQDPPGPGRFGPGGAAAAAPGDRQTLLGDMQHRREQRLHDLLQIKSDQETAFRTFVSSIEQQRLPRAQRQGPLGQPRSRRGGPHGERAALTTPERLDRSLQRLSEAQQRLQKTSAAVKTFYAVLSPEQRKAFDTLPVMGFGGERGLGGRGMPGRFERPSLR